MDDKYSDFFDNSLRLISSDKQYRKAFETACKNCGIKPPFFGNNQLMSIDEAKSFYRNSVEICLHQIGAITFYRGDFESSDELSQISKYFEDKFRIMGVLEVGDLLPKPRGRPPLEPKDKVNLSRRTYIHYHVLRRYDEQAASMGDAAAKERIGMSQENYVGEIQAGRAAPKYLKSNPEVQKIIRKLFPQHTVESKSIARRLHPAQIKFEDTEI